MNGVEWLAVVAPRFVYRVEPGERTREDRRRHIHRDGLALHAGGLHRPRERLAFDVLHHEAELTVLVEDLDRLDDVDVPDARREPRLVHEHRDELEIGGELLRQPLDRDGATALEAVAEPDRRHSACGELSADRVRADGGCVRHERAT